MARYEYDVKNEYFRRKIENGWRGGKPFYVNITEANKIINLINLGYNTTEINDKVSLVNPKATATTIRNFVNKYKKGDILIPKDAPAPSIVYNSLTDSDRLTALEKRVTELENKLNDKPKSIRARLGL